MSGRRSWNDELKSSSRHPRSPSARMLASSARAADTDCASTASALPPTWTLPNRKRCPVSAAFSAPGPLGQRREQGVPGREPDTGADGGDVVQVAPRALELEQDRPGARERRRGLQPERLLAGVGVGDAVRDRAGGAGTRGVAQPLRQGLPDGGALEAAVLVEEAGVEMEDPLADDVEAEVPGLDHAGVDRPDRDLVGVVALHRHGPAGEIEVVVDERPQRLVPLEADAVEVERLPLVPAGRRSEVDDRRHAAGLGRHALDVNAARRRRRAASARSPPSTACRPANRQPAGERVLHPRAVRRSSEPPGERVDDVAARQPERRAGEGEQQHGRRPRRATRTERRPVVGPRRPRRLLARRPSRPGRARARGTRARAAARRPPAAHGRPAWNPPATISTSLTKSGEGGSPASAPSETPSDAAEPGLRCARSPPPRGRRPAARARAAASPRRSRAPSRPRARRCGRRRPASASGDAKPMPSAITPMCSRLE